MRKPLLYVILFLCTVSPSTGQGLDSVSDRQKQYIYHAIKIWGFMKYYHPDAAGGEVEMNEEFIDLLKKGLENPADEGEISKHLLAWFREFSQEFALAESSGDTASNVALKPGFSWICDEPFSEISGDIDRIIYARRPVQHHYFEKVRGVGNPRFINDDQFPSLKADDDYLKLNGLATYWNKIEYFFPYKHLMDKPWDSVLVAFIPKMIESDNLLDYKLTLIELFGSISDTHANLWIRDRELTKFWGEKSLPLSVLYVDGQPVVREVYQSKIAGETTIRAGDVIVEIDGQDVEKLTLEKIRYAPASNRAAQLRDIAGKLIRSNADSMKVVVRRKRKRIEETLNCVYLGQMPDGSSKPLSHKIEAHNIGYIYPGSLKRGEIDSLMQSFMKTKGLIIDFRCYPSDFIVFSLGKYLMPHPMEFAKFSIVSGHDPGVFRFTPPIKVGTVNPDFYKGKVVIIVNETTQSSAEYHAMAFRVAPNARVIGSQTAGADGNISRIMMPGEYRTMISGIGVYYPDGTETQRIGIVPDIEIRPTIEGIREGKDEPLERAIGIINGSKKHKK